MSYSYEEQRAWIFTDEGQRAFTKARDAFLAATSKTGAARAGLIFETCTGDSWRTMALLDRMIELGDLAWVEDGKARAWQHRIVEVSA